MSAKIFTDYLKSKEAGTPLAAISSAKDDWSPGRIWTECGGDFGKQKIAKVYKKNMKNNCGQNNALDFDDLLVNQFPLVSDTAGGTLDYYQERFHILLMVDGIGIRKYGNCSLSWFSFWQKYKKSLRGREMMTSLFTIPQGQITQKYFEFWTCVWRCKSDPNWNRNYRFYEYFECGEECGDQE